MLTETRTSKLPAPNPARRRGSPCRRTGSMAGIEQLCQPHALERQWPDGRVNGSLRRTFRPPLTRPSDHERGMQLTKKARVSERSRALCCGGEAVGYAPVIAASSTAGVMSISSNLRLISA
jgi:hypothetical protein